MSLGLSDKQKGRIKNLNAANVEPYSFYLGEQRETRSMFSLCTDAEPHVWNLWQQKEKRRELTVWVHAEV